MTTAHRTGGSWLETWTPDKVAASPDPVLAFANYTQQVLGVPWPTISDTTVLRKRIKELFQHYPQADYYTLCRVVQYARSRRRRVPRMFMVVDLFREAWADGALPELDPDHCDAAIEARRASALDIETDTRWRARIVLAKGNIAVGTALREWELWREATHE